MKDIKVIGFDLDHTLYPHSEEINKAIQDYICRKIAEIKDWSFNRARSEWDTAYAEFHTGGKALKALGIVTDKDLVQEALENADIYPFLHPDESVVKFLEVLSRSYTIDLITGSALNVATQKLQKLAIPTDIFSLVIAGNYSKIEGTAFTYWLGNYPEWTSDNFLYVGDKYVTDVEAPQKYGITGVLVSAKRDYECPIIDSVTDLPTILSKL